MLRVFVVDDSPFIRKALGRILALRPEMLLVGTAASGPEALERIPAAKPHVVTLDVQMPGGDGLWTLREMVRRWPGLPVIMLSVHTREGADTTLEAMANGAVDFIDKNCLNVMDFDRLSRELLSKLEVWKSGRRGFSWDRTPNPALAMFRPAAARTTAPARSARSLERVDWSQFDLCAIGASTGGPPALQAIVESMPANFPLPIAVVQHMPVGFTKPFADRLNSFGRVHVREAQEQDKLLPGHMVIARAGAHLQIHPDLTASMSLDPLNAPHVPSVDVLMTSAARARGHRVVAFLLTGMGDDGAEGMRMIYARGGLTIAESEETCVVYGMPRAAHLSGGVCHLLPLYDICRLFSQGTSKS
jgi:two-component system, chemotaxis family, protein-glutamate methylesterase/glutaminase